MDDVERGRELSRLNKMQSKLKGAHPGVRANLEQRIDELMEETMHRFLEVFGPEHPIVRELKQS